MTNSYSVPLSRYAKSVMLILDSPSALDVVSSNLGSTKTSSSGLVSVVRVHVIISVSVCFYVHPYGSPWVHLYLCDVHILFSST